MVEYLDTIAARSASIQSIRRFHASHKPLTESLLCENLVETVTRKERRGPDQLIHTFQTALGLLPFTYPRLALPPATRYPSSPSISSSNGVIGPGLPAGSNRGLSGSVFPPSVFAAIECADMRA
jgi:hypothetical protein